MYNSTILIAQSNIFNSYHLHRNSLFSIMGTGETLSVTKAVTSLILNLAQITLFHREETK